MGLKAGVARCVITPYWGVELTGWGYYIERTWQQIHDDLNATALVVDDGSRHVAIVTLDLMVISSEFARRSRYCYQKLCSLSIAEILQSISVS